MTRVRPSARATHRLMVLVVACMTMSSCTNGSGATFPTTTVVTDDTTTSTAAAPGSEEEAVLRAYAASWQAFDAFVNGDPPGEPSDYFDGDHLANVIDRVAQYALDGLELRGEADLAPHDVAIVGAAASLVDCQIDRTYAVERSTGDVVIPASARPQEVVVEMVRSDGRWKVSSVDYGAEGSCDR